MSVSIPIVFVCVAIALVLVYILSRQNVQHFSSPCVYDQKGSKPNKVVLYYAPWCTQCTVFRPEFEKASKTADQTGLNVSFVTVNSDAQSTGSTCVSDHGAIMFPTVQLERASGEYVLYTGLRNANDLLAWVKTSL